MKESAYAVARHCLTTVDFFSAHSGVIIHSKKALNMLKELLLAASVAAAFAATPIVAIAQIYVQVAPPPPRYEAAPAARRNQVWVPGHWEWRRNSHVWTAGYWVKARPGYAYNAPRWVERDGRWNMEQGRWARSNRDRDGDGVPNRRDAQPNNPNRS